MSAWASLLRPGDWAVVGLAAVGVAASFPLVWQGGIAEKAVVRRDGTVVAELDFCLCNSTGVSLYKKFTVKHDLDSTFKRDSKS